MRSEYVTSLEDTYPLFMHKPSLFEQTRINSFKLKIRYNITRSIRKIFLTLTLFKLFRASFYVDIWKFILLEFLKFGILNNLSIYLLLTRERMRYFTERKLRD